MFCQFFVAHDIIIYILCFDLIIRNIKSKMKELVEKINAAIAEFSTNANAQVENGNKAAGTRARKASLELEKLLKEFRKASIEAAK